jgi:F0F1-type ATP synthase assembly protein I
MSNKTLILITNLCGLILLQAILIILFLKFANNIPVFLLTVVITGFIIGAFVGHSIQSYRSTN